MHVSGLLSRRVVLIALSVGLLAFPVVSAARADDRGVDAFGSDPNSLSGTISEVCGPGPSHDAAARRPGRQALIDHLDVAFPDVEGFAGFSCREIHNRRSSCVGRSAPASSDCWSTHAAGRAIDVMVGGDANQSGHPVGGAVGDAIVNHLLERVDGVDNYRARIMGVQQLLWNGACWSTGTHAGAGITDVSQLGRDCVDDHDNHVHITLSEAGADGRTSFHAGDAASVAEVVVGDEVESDQAEGRRTHVVLYDEGTGEVRTHRLGDDGVLDAPIVDDLGTGWTSLAGPDVLGNGDHEVFGYRSSDGQHVIREIRGDGTLGGVVDEGGALPAGYTSAAAPDVDGDGDDELLLYRAEDGQVLLHELSQGGELGPTLQREGATIEAGFASLSTPDLDGDGDDELVLYDPDDGTHVVVDVVGTDGGGPGDGSVTLEVVDDSRVFDREAAAAEVLGLDPPPPPPAALTVALPEGFTSVAAPQVDDDGGAELLLHREEDGCVAWRRLPDADGPVVGADDMPACDEVGDGSSDGDDVTTWMVAVADGFDAATTAAITVALGPDAPSN